MIARVLESVAIVVMFSGKPLGTVCREMKKSSCPLVKETYTDCQIIVMSLLENLMSIEASF